MTSGSKTLRDPQGAAARAQREDGGGTHWIGG